MSNYLLIIVNLKPPYQPVLVLDLSFVTSLFIESSLKVYDN